MIIQREDYFGTGKTEVLKAKATRLSKDPNNFVAFLVARPYPMARTPELLLTKYLRFQFKSPERDYCKRIRVEEIWEDGAPNKENVIDLLGKMFPEFQNDDGTFKMHVFVDEASSQNAQSIEDILAKIPKDSGNFVWIVERDKQFSEEELMKSLPSSYRPPTLSKRFQGDCEIEEGLVMNLRNTQEIQKTIPLIQENRDTNNSEVDTMLLAENLISVLKTERDAKQILVILRNRNDPMIVEKMKMVEDVKFYGISYKNVDNCSDADLEQFFDAPNQEKRQILVTFENFVEGLEAEMVLFPEFHDFQADSTLFRARTKLRTGAMQEFTHPALQKQHSVPRTKVIKETKIGVNRDSGLSSFANFSTLNYSKFRYSHDSKSVASYASYWEFQNYDLNKWREKLERASSIKQYSLVVQESPNKDTNYPLLLWLEMSDEWCSCYALDLDGQFPGNDHHPLNSLTNWDTAEIVELTFHHEMREWKVWKHILKAEILYSHRLNLQLNTKFDFRRLLSIWSRIRKEFIKKEFTLDTTKLNNESYD
ncbi:uncharacterized protein LOC131892242 [Tigriopus californicus]|uniref:uncharacterized protein LOC131892242 n=1 Tax=Tigriopus californicus TaxID=6832 RepID=UPI0027DAA896|nr:uncharacterized protein LOC131892242 [Tigriopus californicus]